MKAGRKRKKGMRERNGRVQRPPVAARDIRDVVLAQPHRHGSLDPFCESFLGQFILHHRLDRLCYDAALSYANLVRRLFAVKGIPQPGNGHHVPDGAREMTAEIARHIESMLQQVDKRLLGISRSGTAAVRQMAVFEREALPEQADEAAEVLRELLQGRKPA
jgi:hypothetical protein